MRELVKNKRHLQNLLILLFLWIVSAFDYYLINFQLKYIDGDIYENTIISSVSEVTAYLISGALYDKIGPKVSFIGSFVLAVVGSVLLITLGDNHVDYVVYMVLGTKFGISGSFNVVYLANSLFPPIYSSTTFGAFNFFARLFSMIAPPFAELQKPLPMSLFCVLAAAAALASAFLRTEKDKEENAPSDISMQNKKSTTE